jgi:hypothetical protein
VTLEQRVHSLVEVMKVNCPHRSQSVEEVAEEQVWQMLDVGEKK